MLHPDLAMALVQDRQRELIAEADQHRRLAAARRAAKSRRRGRDRTEPAVAAPGASLDLWGDRVAAPPR